GKEWTNRYLSMAGGRIIAVSNDVRHQLIEARVPPAKVSMVYNATLDGRFFSEPPQRDAGRSVRLCGIAMFTGNKGHEFIIPLVAKLRDRGQDVYLTLVGDGE